LKNYLLSYFIFLVALSSFAQETQNERAILNQIDSINSLALHYYSNNEIMHSINSINKAIKLSDSIQDNYGNALANFTYGKIYNQMNEFEDAERCFKKMLAFSLGIDDNYLIANSYLSLGNVYLDWNQTTDVIPYYQKALEYAEKKNVIDHYNQDKQQNVLFKIRMQLGSVHLDKQEPNEALLNLLRAEDNLDNAQFSAYNEGLLSFIYGRYFEQKESLYKASDKYDEAVGFLLDDKDPDAFKNVELISAIYKHHANTMANLGEDEEAFSLLLNHNSYREKIINEEKVKQENIAKSRFYNAEYERVAQLANKERILQEQVTFKMQKINLFITFGIFLLFISLVTLYKNYLSKRKLSTILESRNKQLEIAKDQAEKSSQLKTNFISNVTHELRTPLYGVVGLTSMLLKSNDLSTRDSKYLNSLKYSGDYLLNLVNDILQIGKIEAEKVELQLASVNLKQLLGNIIDSFEYRIQENNNEIQLSVDDNLPEFVKCDNVRLSQVLINLIGNSIKFTKNGKIWLGIEVLDFVKEGVSIRFIVKDNGPGIPKNKQQKIFENFSQLNEKTNIDYQGTGLGLSIAKNLVELFDSQIELESEVGEGSEFSFKLTLEIDNEKKIETPEVITKGKTLPLHDKFMILVAEDNKINQIVTQNVLQKGNFECEIVENGLEALNAVKDSTNYDLVLMDLNMPVMNGTDATKEIRKLNPNIPIIALTAADIEEVKTNFSDIGFNDIVTKPFDNFEFYQKITACIQKSKQNAIFDGKLVKVS